ncbi:hypothetical protein ABMA28_010386 [Loxostege sticticalis]|uniref:Peptidase S1 domain-containing protein n=1 Tax=Loxostege sticticalis TaxID=481309 RepID=A0ABD0SAP7_LOXSC
MDYVSTTDCHKYYRRSGLEMAALWPKHAACGRAFEGDECMWSAGTVLAAFQNNKWRLVGVGLFGPGCSAPSKYMDYIMYRPWVMHNVKVPGRTTLTRVAENHIILRRSLSHVRRFGTCDEEESKYEIFSDKTTVDEDVERIGKATYNLTLVDTVEYSCVTVRARSYYNKTTPRIRIRRWCGSTSQFCYDQQHVEIKFHVIIFFNGPTTYEVSAYGRQIKTLNPMEAMKYINQFAKHPVMPEYSEFKNMFQRDSNGYFWVPGWEDGSYEGFKIRRYEVYEHCVSNTSSSDRRFCGLYEFAVEPDWWFDLTTKNENQRPASKYHHFVWRYLSQRQKLQYPTDGYELIIDPEKQDRRNERLERNQYKMKFFPLYNPPDYFVPQGNKYTNIYRLINTLPSSLCGVGVNPKSCNSLKLCNQLLINNTFHYGSNIELEQKFWDAPYKNHLGRRQFLHAFKELHDFGFTLYRLTLLFYNPDVINTQVCNPENPVLLPWCSKNCEILALIHARLQCLLFFFYCVWVTVPEHFTVCLSVRLFVCPSVRLSVCPSVRLFVCPSVRPSVTRLYLVNLQVTSPRRSSNSFISKRVRYKTSDFSFFACLQYNLKYNLLIFNVRDSESLMSCTTGIICISITGVSLTQTTFLYSSATVINLIMMCRATRYQTIEWEPYLGPFYPRPSVNLCRCSDDLRKVGWWMRQTADRVKWHILRKAYVQHDLYFVRARTTADPSSVTTAICRLVRTRNSYNIQQRFHNLPIQ